MEYGPIGAVLSERPGEWKGLEKVLDCPGHRAELQLAYIMHLLSLTHDR